MLRSWAQASRIPLPRPWQPVRRTNSAAGQASVDSHDPNETLTFAGNRPALPVVKRPGLSVRIRLTKFLGSPAEAFAVIRAVERKYGALTEYRFYRDFEVGSKYQSVVHAVFRDLQSVDRISADDTLRIPAPRHVPDRPGGIGLDELGGLLELQEHVKEASLPAFENVIESVFKNGEENNSFIECRVTRSKQDFFTVGRLPSYYSRRSQNTIARSFINWSGFSDLEPIEKGTPIANEDLFATSPIDHVRMRRAIRRWSDLSNLGNPYEYKRQLIRTTDHVDWEPLPGYEHSSEDVPVPMPSTIDASQSYPSQSTPQPEIPENPITVPSAPSTDSKLTDVNSSSSTDSKLIDVNSSSSTPSNLTDANSSSSTDSNLTDANSSSPAILLDNAPPEPPSKPLEKQIRSGVPFNSIHDEEVVAAQLKAARDLVKRTQPPEKKKVPARQMSSPAQGSKSSPTQRGKIIRPLVKPAKVEQESTATQRLKSFFNGWF